MLMKAGGLAEAAEKADELWRKRPEGAGVVKVARLASFRLATDYMGRGKTDEAIRWCERAAEYEPRDWRPFYYKGQACVKARRYDEAERALLAALERREEPKVLWALANLYFMREDYTRAIPVYQKVMEAGEKTPLLLVNLGTAFWKTGENREALDALEGALELNPGDETVQKIVDKLRRELEVEGGYDSHERGDFAVSFERSDEQRGIKDKVLPTLQRALGAVERELGRHEGGVIQVVLYPGGEEFKEAVDAPNWAGALWDGKLRIPIETARGADEERLEPILRHELTHLLLRQKYARLGRLPGWLNEGLAQVNEGRDVTWARNLLRATVGRRDWEKMTYPFDRLEGGFTGFPDPASARMAYAQAYYAVKYLQEKVRFSAPTDVLELMNDGATGEEALRRVAGQDYAKFNAEWRAWLCDEFNLGGR